MKYREVGKDGGRIVVEYEDGSRAFLDPVTKAPIPPKSPAKADPKAAEEINNLKAKVSGLETANAQLTADLTTAKDALETANNRIKELEGEKEEEATTEGADEREKQLKAQQAAAAGVKDDLTTIDGVDVEIAKALADAGFDTFDKIKAASVEDLEKVSGIGKATAKKIKAHFG